MKFDPVAIARQFLYLREAQTLGQNQGQRVNAVQFWSGGKDAIGTSWCAWFVTFVLDIAFQGHSPIPRMGSTQEIYRLAQSNGWLRSKGSVGDLFLYLNAEGVPHHVGMVTAINPLDGIAGNTSPDGASTNGDGVYEHPIKARVFVAYPRK